MAAAAILNNGHISATAHDLLRLYSTHRAVIFAIAQLSCFTLLNNLNTDSINEILILHRDIVTFEL